MSTSKKNAPHGAGRPAFGRRSLPPGSLSNVSVLYNPPPMPDQRWRVSHGLLAILVISTAYTLLYLLRYPDLLSSIWGKHFILPKALSLINTLFGIMVNAYNVGGIAARALLATSSRLHERADQATYTSNSLSAIRTLQTWYNKADGLWDTAGWWNSANCLTVLADFAALDPKDAVDMGLRDVFETTFTKAQTSPQTASKALSKSGLVSSTYTRLSARDLAVRGFAGFINEFYDDEGWWALGLIRAFDVTNDHDYLSTAEDIFEDMKNGTDDTCGGGIWWSKERKYKNAIANELYLSVAASLANRASNKQYYLDIARKEWDWFKGSGMINDKKVINDGLKINDDGSCTNNGQQTWSYNQGVILGGLVELAKASGDSSLLPVATEIASAAIGALSKDGILHEPCEPDCGGDGDQFKGVFMRNLHYLQKAAPKDEIKEYILKNADAIWASDRNTKNNQLGVVWTGPFDAGDGPTAASHSSAMDALVAAMAVA